MGWMHTCLFPFPHVASQVCYHCIQKAWVKELHTSYIIFHHESGSFCMENMKAGGQRGNPLMSLFQILAQTIFLRPIVSVNPFVFAID